MKKQLSIGLAAAFVVAFGVTTPASANPQTEDIFSACFNAPSGSINRNQSVNASSGSNDYQNWYQTNTLVRKSGQLFRGTYSGWQEIYQNSGGWTNTQAQYDYDAQQKTVYSQSYEQQYFSSFLYESFVGWLVSESGDRIRSTSWTSRTRSTDARTGFSSRTTDTIARNCDLVPLAADVVKFELKPGEASTLEMPTYSANGFQIVEIEVTANAVSSAATLLAWNDPNATENRHGLGSLGFRLTGLDGGTISLNQPLKVTFQKTKENSLAYSFDAANWKWLPDTEVSLREGVSLSKDTKDSFLISSLSPTKWIFVGQKQDQSSVIAYANKFSAAVGKNIRLTTTSGSGKGPVIFKSLTPEICEATSAKAVQGKSTGECKLLATKLGFDGYMDSKTQVLSLKIGD